MVATDVRHENPYLSMFTELEKPQFTNECQNNNEIIIKYDLKNQHLSKEALQFPAITALTCGEYHLPESFSFHNRPSNFLYELSSLKEPAVTHVF
jgi:hypothetical protein